MKAKFFCKTGLLAGAKYVIDREARIGKDPNNHIVLDTKIVSGQHARIFFDDNEQSYFLEDLQSRNGTRLDGLPVAAAEKLDDLHVITLAEKFDFIFQLAAAATGIVQERTADRRTDQKAVLTSPPKAPPPTPKLKDDLQKTMPGGQIVMPSVFDKDDTARSKEDLQKTMPGGQIVMPSVFDKDDTARPKEDLQKTMPGGQIVMPPSFDKDATARPKDDLQKTMPGGQIVMPPVFDKDDTARPKDDLQKTLQGTPPPLPNFQNREAVEPAAPKQKPVSSAVTFFLEIKRAGKEATVFTLKEGENIVGRQQDCDIPIDDVSISRQHAVVTVKAKRVMVRDLGSKNRTFIGDRVITDEAEIRLDTRLKFGAVEAYLIYKAAQ